MATKKETEAVVKETVTEEKTQDVQAYLMEKVPFYAFKDSGKYRDDIVVGYNGKIYRIKRGENVMIPRAVYNIIKNSMDQDAHTADLIDAQKNEFARNRGALE